MSLRDTDPSEVLARARRSWSPEAGAAERVRRGLEAKLAAGAATARAPSAGRPAPVWPARLLLAGAFAAATGGAGYWAGYRAGRRAAPGPRAAPTASVAQAASVASFSGPPPPPAPPAAVAHPIHAAIAAPSFVPTRRGTHGGRQGADGTPARENGSLAIELRALRNAERALRDGRPGLALAFLQDLDRQVPHGELTEEREAAATLVRCARGDQPFGVSLAEEFSARHPTSVYRARVEQACAATDPAAPGDSPARRSEP
jgi:hypothetical protein